MGLSTRLHNTLQQYPINQIHTIWGITYLLTKSNVRLKFSKLVLCVLHIWPHMFTLRYCWSLIEHSHLLYPIALVRLVFIVERKKYWWGKYVEANYESWCEVLCRNNLVVSELWGSFMGIFLKQEFVVLIQFIVGIMVN